MYRFYTYLHLGIGLAIFNRKYTFNKQAVRLSKTHLIVAYFRYLPMVSLDVPSSVTRLGDLLDLRQVLKPLAEINLPKSQTFLGIYCKGLKIYQFSSDIIFGQFL